MLPWSIDAREAINDIKDVDKIDPSLIAFNEDIKKMLYDDRYIFIIGTKGFGKSFLLLYKRKLVKNSILIPQKRPLDIPHIAYLSNEAQHRLYDKRELCLLWTLSLSIIIAKVYGMNCIEHECSQSLKWLMNHKLCNTMSSVMNKIITEIDRKEFIKDLSNDYNILIYPFLQSINSPIYIFIDNLDECFESFGSFLWYSAPQCLIKSVYDLIRLNPNLKIFASIRKEAFLKFENEMIMQYRNVSLMLRYSKDDLKKIFINNINKDDIENLREPDFINEYPIIAFLGTDKIKHGFVNEEEDTFDYIYRHTLRRPVISWK